MNIDKITATITIDTDDAKLIRDGLVLVAKDMASCDCEECKKDRTAQLRRIHGVILDAWQISKLAKFGLIETSKLYEECKSIIDGKEVAKR